MCERQKNVTLCFVHLENLSKVYMENIYKHIQNIYVQYAACVYFVFAIFYLVFFS